MNFNELGINEIILDTIERIGHTKPTPIQEKGIPLLLERKDVLASAQTGTGKTATFAIPILQNIYKDNLVHFNKDIRALILTPTRELAIQVGEVFHEFSRGLKIRSLVIYGGVPQTKQTQALNRGTTVLVATPGRLMDLVNQGFIDLSSIEYFVLDEADQMLDMGFINDVRKIVKMIPANRQTMLFSATMPNNIIKLADEVLNDYSRIEVTPVNKTLDVITQEVYHVLKSDKTNLLIDVINKSNIPSILVFTRTKHMANRVVKALNIENISAEAIHGNKSQNARQNALESFKQGKTRVLVATDIAARGIDISELSLVINYDLPEVAETYIHRIGRTGRAGASGVAISFCDLESLGLLSEIEKHINSKINVIYDHAYLIKGKQDTKGSNKANTNNRKKKSSGKPVYTNKLDNNGNYKKKVDNKKPYYKKKNTKSK